MIIAKHLRYPPRDSMNAFVYSPEITFDDTNVVGNVYFANFIRWQGACRETFLKEHAPSVLARVARQELILHTSEVNCKFEDPQGVTIEDDVIIEMRLDRLKGGRLTMSFAYYRQDFSNENNQVRVATGMQKICCKIPTSTGLVAAVFPTELLIALRSFTDDEEILANIESAIEFSTDQPTRGTESNGRQGAAPANVNT